MAARSRRHYARRARTRTTPLSPPLIPLLYFVSALISISIYGVRLTETSQIDPRAIFHFNFSLNFPHWLVDIDWENLDTKAAFHLSRLSILFSRFIIREVILELVEITWLVAMEMLLGLVRSLIPRAGGAEPSESESGLERGSITKAPIDERLGDGTVSYTKCEGYEILGSPAASLPEIRPKSIDEPGPVIELKPQSQLEPPQFQLQSRPKRKARAKTKRKVQLSTKLSSEAPIVPAPTSTQELEKVLDPEPKLAEAQIGSEHTPRGSAVPDPAPIPEATDIPEPESRSMSDEQAAEEARIDTDHTTDAPSPSVPAAIALLSDASPESRSEFEALSKKETQALRVHTTKTPVVNVCIPTLEPGRVLKTASAADPEYDKQPIRGSRAVSEHHTKQSNTFEPTPTPKDEDGEAVPEPEATEDSTCNDDNSFSYSVMETVSSPDSIEDSHHVSESEILSKSQRVRYASGNEGKKLILEEDARALIQDWPLIAYRIEKEGEQMNREKERELSVAKVRQFLLNRLPLTSTLASE
ncbi:hypothetical protein BJY04DRAFT_220590 [Aspergillus karnatakaensis]|uniref:uncharacterized protein n=1 Tax=Aspergillus karnatakaensis TaxID=1810916 RepID=UPI003CCDB043